jgi:glycosyltransferase involved in cell wall biosynthesis
MKIALAVPGGVDRSGRDRVVPMFLWLIERLSRRHDLHVFALDYYDEPCSYELGGAAVHDLGRPRGLRGTRRFQVARRLADALRAHGPFDLLHAYWGMPAAIAAARVAPQLGTPLIVTLDSGELVRFDDIGYGLQRRWIDRRALRHALERAAMVTVPTSYMASLMPRSAARPAIVPVGVDRSTFPSGSPPEGPPWRLIRVASLNRVKDYPTLLQAFRLVVDREPRVTLDIAGEDLLGGAIQRLAAELGIEDRITFHGALPTAALAALYRRAHLNVLSSRHESANVTVLEAACSGIATVGSAVGYVADWSPERAVAVPARHPKALADAIIALLHDEPRRRQIAEAARAWALAHDADWTAAAFDRLYHQVTRAGRRAHRSGSR